MSNPQSTDDENAYAAPMPVVATVVNDGQGDATGGVIPYKNVPALLAYYCGVFSLIPVIGFVLAIPAFVLGIIGLRKKKLRPEVRGTAHAWIGIVLGFLMIVLYGGILVVVVSGALKP